MKQQGVAWKTCRWPVRMYSVLNFFGLSRIKPTIYLSNMMTLGNKISQGQCNFIRHQVKIKSILECSATAAPQPSPIVVMVSPHQRCRAGISIFQTAHWINRRPNEPSDKSKTAHKSQPAGPTALRSSTPASYQLLYSAKIITITLESLQSLASITQLFRNFYSSINN